MPVTEGGHREAAAEVDTDGDLIVTPVFRAS